MITLARLCFLLLFVCVGFLCRAQALSLPADSVGGRRERPASDTSWNTEPRILTPAEVALLEARDEAAFLAKHDVRHRFGRFYQDATGQCYWLGLKWGSLEFAKNRFLLVACPAFDSATFENEYPFWRDRSQVAYAQLSYNQHKVELLRKVDPKTFHSLHVDNLGADNYHVYAGSYLIPRLRPAGLRVYTNQGERFHYGPNSYGDTYLVSGNVLYAPNLGRFSKKQARDFRIPDGYQLVYPLPPATPAKTSSPH